jgi:hypothetical protein
MPSTSIFIPTHFSILYMRAVYPVEEFVQKSKYGLGLWITNNRDLDTYINNILTQVQGTETFDQSMAPVRNLPKASASSGGCR